ncbi:MAG: hypothetical protein ABF301_02500 [Sulfurovum sp.]
MKLSDFLNDIQNNNKEVIYYCAKHLLSKKYDVENDSIDEEELKSLFTDYSTFSTLLNDSAFEIYKKYSSEIDDIYETFCSIFDIDADNESVFKYRLVRVSNQDPKNFLNIEDRDHQETVIQKFEDKVEKILSSKFYKENESELSKEMVIPQKTLDMIKSAVGMI